MIAWQEKLWGRCRHLYADDRVQLDEIAGAQGGASSLHLHAGKHNTFLVTRGVLDVFTTFSVPPDGEIEAIERRLTTGDTLTIKAGRKHRMVFVTYAEGYELYTAAGPTPLDPADIVRFDEGRAGATP